MTIRALLRVSPTGCKEDCSTDDCVATAGPPEYRMTAFEIFGPLSLEPHPNKNKLRITDQQMDFGVNMFDPPEVENK
jgi:hypothetical protein